MDVSTAFMSLSHKVTASSSSSSCVVMFVSMLDRLSFSVLCSKSSFAADFAIMRNLKSTKHTFTEASLCLAVLVNFLLPLLMTE